MIGPKHVPTYLEVVNFETDLLKHHQKLSEIHHTSKKRDALEQQFEEKNKLFETRERGLKFHQSERLLAIEKDNELLLGKLVEISRKKKTPADLKNDKHHVGTLNAPHRKREKNRIAAENEAFARRLLSQQPSFNRKKLELDYEKHNERVKQMKKVSMFSPRVKLPPIHKDDQVMRKSKSGGTLRDTKAKKEDKKKLEQLKKEEEERQEKELEAQKQREKEEQEEKERKEKEERELKEKEENARKEKEEQERKENEEKEAKEKADKEKAEKEAAEKKAEEERLAKEAAEKAAEAKKEETPEEIAEDKRWEQLDAKDDKNDAMMGMFRGMVPTK